MKRRIGKLTLLAVGILMMSALASAGEIGKITAIEGKVDILQPGQSEARPAGEGAVISVGDFIRTKSASKAGVTFTDNTVLNLAQNTRIEVKDYQLDAQGKRVAAVINVERGKIRATVSKSAAKDSFIINTPNASGIVKGTDLFVIYQKSSTGVVVLDGKVSVANSSLPNKSIEIASGDITVISSDQPPTATRTLLAMEKKSHEADTQIAKVKEEKPLSAEGYSKPEDMTAIVVKVSGGAQIRSRGAIAWHAAKLNEVLTAGDVIETKDDGKIEIKLENGNVINLKPDSQLKLQKLSKDLKTGDYENLLESSHGKIKAQVQKIKGNSKFEIKTPTAVACVRGTILFLNILPNMTSAYFENGNGTVQNVVSGVIQTVADGNSSSADDQGNVSPPAPPSDEQQSEWQEGWEGEGGGEGYSPPGGDTEGGDTGEDTGGEDTGGADLGEGGSTDNSPFDDVPVTDNTGLGDTGDTTTTGDTLTPTLQANFTGLFGNYGSFKEDANSSFSATLTSYTDAVTITPWPGTPDPEDFTIAGTYSNPSGRHLWFGEVPVIQIGNNGLLGWVGGSWGSSWEGALSFIYIDSSGTAGHLFGYMSGPADDATGTFSGDGDLFIIPKTEPDSFLPQNLSASIVNGSGGGELYVSFDGGYLDTEFYRETKKIDGENWGIWREIHRGTYDRPDELPLDRDGLPHWIGVAGGNYNNGGYFFSAFEGVDNLDDLLRIDVFGTYLDYEKLGAYYGTILGAYGQSELDNFEGVGLGGFEEEALSSSGYLDNALYYYGSWNGYFYGLIGTTGQLWNEEPFNLVSIGDFYNYYGNEPFVWSSGGTTLYSENPLNETYTTYDGGAFYGMTGGIGGVGGLDNLKGLVRVLYIDPDRNAGVMSGDLLGAYSNNVGYLLQGDISKTRMVENISVAPEDLYYSIGYGGGSNGTLSGLLGTDGSIQGNYNLTTMNIVDYANGTEQLWGIYGQDISGSFTSPSDPSATWSAKIGGNDSFGVVNPYIYYTDGRYLSYDATTGLGDGRYDYSYYPQDNSGWVYYYDSDDTDGAFQSYVYYSTDGKYYVYNSIWNLIDTQPWDPGTESVADRVTAPPIGHTSTLSYENNYGTGTNDSGYWLANITDGAWNADGTLSADSITGKFLTYTKMGDMSGRILGAYNTNEGRWQAVGAGAWDGTPLKFANDFNANSSYGSLNGIMGGTDSLWSGTPSITILGSYVNSAPDALQVWTANTIYSHNYLDGSNTAYDGSSYYGMMGGTQFGKDIQAALIALYINNGRAGYFTSDLSGTAYPDINMFEMTNTAFNMVDKGETDISPEDLSNSVWSTSGNGALSGSLGTDGTISGQGGFTTMSFVDYTNEIAQPWGIYSQDISGSFTSPTEASTTWSAKMGGNDAFGVVNPTLYTTGQCYYSVIEDQGGVPVEVPDGYSDYNYYANNTSGSITRYDNNWNWRYNITYNSNGTYNGYDYIKQEDINGTWDPDNDSLSVLVTAPPQFETASISSSSENSYGTGNNDSGYWLADITDGAWNADGTLSANLTNGKFITPTKIGDVSGQILGAYYDYGGGGEWEAVGAGAWEGERLTLSGRWGNNSLYDNRDSGNFEWVGEDYGLIGSTTPEWWNQKSFDILAMGQYDISNEGGPYTEPFIWNTPIQRYNAREDNSTTLDGGAFDGYTAGIWNDENMDGAVAAIYVAPTGTGEYSAGVLRGVISGNYYPDLEMWSAEGNLTPVQKATALIIDPERLYPGGGSLEQSLIGNTKLYGPGSIYGSQSPEYQSYSYYIPGEDWGIFNIKLGNGNSYSIHGADWSATMGGTGLNGDSDSYWLADNISGTWQNDEIRAGVSGNFLSYDSRGTFEGDLFGVNYSGGNEGTWIATAIGSWEETTPLALSGNIDGYYYYYDDSNDYIDHDDDHYGIFGTTESPFAAPGAGKDLYLMGKAYPYSYITWWSSIEGNNYVDRNSHWYGWIGGITKPDNTIAGIMKALYIDGSGYAGILSGDFAGTNYADLKMWSAEGNLTADQKSPGYSAPDFWNYIDYSYPDGYAYGQFAGAGTSNVYSGDWLQSIYYDETATYWFINPTTNADEPWGIYKLELGGYYDNKPVGATNFSMEVGGGDWKSYYRSYSDYWITHISGTWNADKTIEGNVTGNYISPFVLGNITGSLLGSYDTYDPDTWEAVALGAFTEEPLKFVSDVYGNFNGSGYLDALMGGTDSLWSGTPSLTIIGEYENSGSVPAIWTTDTIQSHNYLDTSKPNTTYDGGAYYGMMGGTQSGNSIQGGLAALYINNGRAGYFTSDLSGTAYPDINMFEMTKTAFNRVDKGDINIAPNELSNSIWPTEGKGTLSGSLGTNGTISGTDNFSTMNIVDFAQEREQPWGIYGQDISGSFMNPPTTSTPWSAKMGGNDAFGVINPTILNSEKMGSDDSGYWLADINGAWNADNTLSANLTNGKFITLTKMGDISGQILGIHDDTEWQAVGLGAWEGTPLAFNGSYYEAVYIDPVSGNSTDGAFGHYDIAEGFSPASGSVDGLLGGTVLLGTTPTAVTFIGEYSNPNDDKLFAFDVSGSATDGTSFLGTAGGVALNNSLEGGLLAMYIKPIEGTTLNETGYIMSTDLDKNSKSITGTFYPQIGMFEANGNLAAFAMGTTAILPGDLNEQSGALEGNDFAGTISKGGYGINGTVQGQLVMLNDQNWGLWSTAAGGTYDNIPTAGWNTVISSTGGSYWIATMSGEKWENDKPLRATLTGVNFYGNSLGKISGNMIGTYDATTWQALNVGKFEQIVDLSTKGITDVNMLGNGWGQIGTELMAGLLVGQVSAAEPNAKTGSFDGILAGTGNISDSNWKLALGAQSFNDTGAVEGYLLGTAENNPDHSNWFHGVYFGLDTGPNKEARFSMGKIDGTISEISNIVDTTWDAKATGQWVDLAVLSQAVNGVGGVGFDNTALASMVNVPITETYSSLLLGAGSFTDGGAIIATMDISMYASAADALSGIWAALINGNYTDPTSDTWSVAVDNGNVTLTGSQWSDGQWLADVSGTVNSAAITGQAGGTYTGITEGTLTGVGAGTWQPPTPPPQP